MPKTTDTVHALAQPFADVEKLELPLVNDRLSHYVGYNADMENIVNGTPVVALCGVRWADDHARQAEASRGNTTRTWCVRCEYIRRRFLPNSRVWIR